MEATFLITKNKGASNILPISADNIIQIKHELGLAHSDIYEHDFVCFLEGESERDAFSIIAQRIKPEFVFKLGLWVLGGYGNLKNIKILIQYLKNTNRKIYALVDENSTAKKTIEELINDRLLEQENVCILNKNFEDQFSSSEIILSVKKLSRIHGFEFELSAAELTAQRNQDKPVDKILIDMLQDKFSLSKPELARELAYKIDLSKQSKNLFLNFTIRILNSLNV